GTQLDSLSELQLIAYCSAIHSSSFHGNHSMRSMTRRSILGALACSALIASASAQEFPSRPITLVVGLAAGGITDVTARLYGEALSRLTGQRVTVENRTGAGGGVAAALVQNA